MKVLDTIRDRMTGALAGAQVGAQGINAAMEAVEEQEVRSKESLADLELALEDVSWRDLMAPFGSWNFSRMALRKLTALSRVMYLVNPLIRRAVTVQELYVWGSSCTIKADDATVNEVLEDFFCDPKNQTVIGNSWDEREREQRIDGNQFFVFYLNKVNGASRVRLLPFDQVDDIIYNPDDSKDPWFYRRSQMSATRMDGAAPDPMVPESDAMLFPDIGYNPKVKPTIHEETGLPIKWNTRILHVKTGGLSNMRFGIPELYSALSWATAYKKMLENFATKEQAFARLAMKMSGLSGKKGIAASKSKLGTGITNSQLLDNNPPENTASWMLMSGNADVSAIKTSGMQTSPDTAHPLRSMVASGTDTPEHFFGDSDIGNFATSSTLDRPTELKMVARQKFWMNIILTICNYLIEWSAKAPQGKLREANFKATTVRGLFDGEQLVIITPPKGKNLNITVEFPSILERDVTDRVRAVVQAATLGGSPAEGIIPDRRLLFKLLMVALGEKNAQMLVDEFYPVPVQQGFIDPADKMKNETLIAQGRKELGDAALKQADAAKIKAENPPEPAPAPSNPKKPKPSGSPKAGVSNQ